MKQLPITDQWYQIFSDVGHPKFGGIDICKLEDNSKELPPSLLQFFFKEMDEELDFAVGPYLESIIQKFAFRAHEYQMKRGGPLMAIGYPMLSFQVDRKVYHSALLLCPVNMVYEPGVCKVKQVKHAKVYPNYWLLETIKTQLGIDLLEVFEDFTSGQRLDHHVFPQFIQQFADLVSRGKVDQFEQITPLANTELEEYPYLWNSAVLGCFPSQHFPSFSRKENHQKLAEKGVNHEFGLLSLDPFQATAFKSTFTNNRVVVSGPQGSGKTHLAVQLITNGLSNGHRCLVISSHLAPLKEIQKRLTNSGLTLASFLLQQPFQGIYLLLDFVRSAINGNRSSVGYGPLKGFQGTLTQLMRLKRKLDTQHVAAKEEILCGYHWTELVGRYLERNREEGKAFLVTQLNPQDFSFSDKEYMTLQNAIRKSETLFHVLSELDSPLAKLNHRIFLSFTEEASKAYVNRTISFLGQKGEKLMIRYASFLADYEDALFLFYDKRTGRVLEDLVNLKETIRDGRQSFGEQLDASPSGLNVKAIFSSNAKRVVAYKKEIQRLYRQLSSHFNTSPLFDFKFPDEPIDSVAETEKFIANFETTLNLWRRDINRFIQDEKNRLTTKTVFSPLGLDEQLRQLTYDFDLFQQQVRQEAFFEEPFASKHLIIGQQHQFLVQFVNELQKVSAAMPEFEPYYRWHKHWLHLDNKSQMVVQAMINAKVTQWQGSFESWYWHHALIKFNNIHLPVNHEDLEAYIELERAFKSILPTQINAQIQHLLLSTAQATKKHQKQLYTQIMGQKSGAGSSDLGLDAAGQAQLLNMLPCLLTSVSAFSEVAHSELMDPYDLIIVEEAHTLHADLLSKLSSWGKRVVFLLDEDQATDAVHMAGGINEYRKNHATSNLTLDMLHRWQPGNLLAFGNGRQLNPQFVVPFEIKFHDVGGRFSETELTNEEEAHFILKWLNNIQETPQRTLPKIGIVCFTEEQASLLYQYFSRIKNQHLAGAERIKQLERNGLEISTIMDLVGADYDIILMTLTYGVIDLKGKVSTEIGILNQPAGQIQLRRLIASGANKMHIVRSLPTSFLEEAFKGGHGQGLFLLSTYLLFLEAIANGDVNKQEEVLLTFEKVLPRYIGGSKKKKAITFLKEVMLSLSPLLSRFEIIEPFELANIQFPVVLQRKDQPEKYYYFICDGFFSNHPNVDYCWEYEQIQFFREKNFEPIWIWSVNWWKNKEHEINRILSYLESEHIKVENATSRPVN